MSVPTEHHPPPPASKARQLIVGIALAFGLIVLVAVYGVGYSRGTATSSLDFAHRSDCRAEFTAWVQQARDHVTNGQGTISQGTYRALKQLRNGTDNNAKFDAALKLGDAGDSEIASWNDKVLVRQAAYLELTRLQRTDPGRARDLCADGPPT